MNKYDWKSIYKYQTKSFSKIDKPIIGITVNSNAQKLELAEGYWKSVEEAGGIPILLTPSEDKDVLTCVLNQVDAIILSGGGDINPLCFNEDPLPELGNVNPQRDIWELLLTRFAFNLQIPILGICRGMQVLTCALEGSIHQDIKKTFTNTERLIKHNQDLPREEASHFVETEPGSLIRHLLGEHFPVNSFHHQAVNETGLYLQATACSADGVIEAVESSECKPILGVQWHPECFILKGDKTMMPLFSWLVKEAKLFKKAKLFHQKYISLDSHCDTPMHFTPEFSFFTRNEKTLVDLPKMYEGHLDAAVLVAYLPQGNLDEETHQKVNQKAHGILNEIKAKITNNPYVSVVQTTEQLHLLKQQQKKGILLGIENGYAFGKEIAEVEVFRKRGVVYTTLCHNGDNLLCDAACRSQNTHNGISPFGENVIEEMNRVGMMVDLSHGSERSFYDALEISKVPIICSHSSARALCEHPRNLSDDQLRALAETGGVAQVTLYSGFLQQQGKATIYKALEHLKHMIDVAGIESVGIGTDFDGDGGILGCASASELINFTKLMLLEHYSESDMELIWGGNFLRVMNQAQQYAQQRGYVS